MPLQIGQANIAGAVIAVVKDGALVFAKGYGYADTAKKTPISPEMTLFRPWINFKIIHLDSGDATGGTR